MKHDRPPAHPRIAAAAMLAVVAALAAGCGGSGPGATASAGAIVAVGAENEYANVIEQVGGAYVKVTAIESNPNTDPHTFEASPSVAEVVAAARLVVQNGVGYDTYMERIESASPSSQRRVIDVQKLLGLPDSTPNPHLWYRPQTMPAVAKAIAASLSELAPAHAAYFQARAASFERSLTPWNSGDRAVRRRISRHPGRDHRAGRRLHAGSGRDRQPDAVRAAGGHHERGRSRRRRT